MCVLGQHQRDKVMPPPCFRGDVPGRSGERHDTEACRHGHAVHTFQPTQPRKTICFGLVPFAGSVQLLSSWMALRWPRSPRGPMSQFSFA